MRTVCSLSVILGLTATLAVSNSTQLSAYHVIAHYVDIGDQGQPELLAADSAGNLFVVSTIVKPWGRRQIRVSKTDPAGNVLASFELGESCDCGLHLLRRFPVSAPLVFGNGANGVRHED